MEQIPTETFADYMGNARNKFVNDIQQQKWNTELRTSAEDILIAYDQMRNRIEELQSQCTEKEKECEELRAAFNDRVKIIEMQLKDKEELKGLIEKMKPYIHKYNEDNYDQDTTLDEIINNL